MDYKEWIVAIYDQYLDKYFDQYPDEKKRVKFKDIPLKNKLKMLYVISTAVLGFYLMFVSLNDYNFYLFLLGMGFTFIAPFFVMYTADLKLNTFTKHLDILKKVLDEQNLLTHDKIKILAKETGTIFYKISNSNLEWFIKLVPGLFGTAALSALIPNLSKNVAILILSGTILLLELIYLGYTILTFVPNSRIKRRKRFHELLRILLIQVDDNKNS